MRIVYRHKKRGTEYELMGYGKMQAEGWQRPIESQNASGFGSGGHTAFAPVDMYEVAIYRNLSDDNEIWVRPRDEFEDGRFDIVFAEDAE